MRILYLLFSFSIGGTERLVADICNEMVDRNNQVFLYIVNDLVSEDLLKTLDKRVNITLQLRKAGKGDKLATLVKISKFIRKNKIDIVHCNSLNSPDLLLVSKVFNKKLKIVYTIHGLGQYKTLGRQQIKFRNNICDSIVCVSDSVKNDIVLDGADISKTCTIYNGINIEKYNVTKFKQFDSSNIIVSCIGRINPREKGQDLLLKAYPIVVKKYPNVKLVFAGGVSSEQQNEFLKMREFVKSNGFDNSIIFKGLLSDIPSFLNTVDICVVPSRSEGFGLALVEAMAMGVPCVSSDNGGLKEIIDNEKIGLMFKNGEYHDLARVLIRVLDDYDYYKFQSWNNKDNIKRKYSISNMCDKLEVLYNRICSAI